MPQSRLQTTTSTSTTPTPAVTPQTGGGDNSFLADVLSGRTRVDGDVQTWFDRGVRLQIGMKGDAIAQLQALVGASVDGAFGPGTLKAVKAWQRKNGLVEDGSIDAVAWEKLISNPAKLGGKPEGEAAFADMWASHPHNYLSDSSLGENTESGDLNESLGFGRDQFANTCALRMSTMLNRMGNGEHRITADKAKAAGLDKMRQGGLYLPKANDKETAATDDRVIVAAKEMWTYLEHHYGPPDQVWPPRGRNLKRADAEKAAEEAQAAVTGKKGFIAFDNLQLQDESGQFTGYGGSGHVDIFDGGQLSDGSFYPAQRIMVWYVVK
jgi:hypothetical protein